MNSHEGSVEENLISLLKLPQITTEILEAANETVRMISSLSPEVKPLVEQLVLNSQLNCSSHQQNGVNFANFVDSLPRDLYFKVLLDLTAIPNLDGFNWLQHALISKNTLTLEEWEALVNKGQAMEQWDRFETLVKELGDVQKTTLYDIVNKFPTKLDSNSANGDRQKLEAPSVKLEPCFQPLPNLSDSPQDIITIDDDDEPSKKDNLRIKVENMCSSSNGPFLGVVPNSGVDVKPFVTPKSELKPKMEANSKVGANKDSQVYLIPGSRKETPGGSFIQVFQKSGKRKRKSGSQTPSQLSSLSQGNDKEVAADKESIVAPASSEDESAGAKRRRSHVVSDPGANPTRSREKQTTPLSSTSSPSLSAQSARSQPRNDWAKNRSPASSLPVSSSGPGRMDVVPGVKRNSYEDISASSGSSETVSPALFPSSSSLSSSPSPALGHPSQKEDVEDSQSGDDPEVIFDECCICGESIPRMMDNPRSSMIHHMAQEHDDIPSGVPTSSPYCSVRCRRCRLFFQDLFIRDLHEKKACQAPECEGCKLSSSQSEMMMILHLASKHGEIPPGCPTQMSPADVQCCFCKLWFNATIYDQFHQEACVTTTHLL